MDGKIINLWEKYTLQKVNPDIDFFESGGDSLSAINLIVEVQKIYSVDISVEKFMLNPSISFLDKLINDKAVKVGS